jgi:hypothetical protein
MESERPEGKGPGGGKRLPGGGLHPLPEGGKSHQDSLGTNKKAPARFFIFSRHQGPLLKAWPAILADEQHESAFSHLLSLINMLLMEHHPANPD